MVEAATESLASKALTLVSSGGASVSVSGSRTINVTDNDSASVSITSDPTTVAEGGSSQNVTATLSLTVRGDPGGDELRVAVSVKVPGNPDYTATTVTFLSGSTEGT